MPRKFTTAPCRQCGKLFQRPDKRSAGFCSRACFHAWFHGPNHANWRGGRNVMSHGYVQIQCPNHPHADQYGYVLEHRLVMERHLGRVLASDELVHHRNGNKQDNRLDNLELTTRPEHARMHRPQGRWSKYGNCCAECGTTERYHQARGLCYNCYVRLRLLGDLARHPLLRRNAG
jgi:hypothetical protein